MIKAMSTAPPNRFKFQQRVIDGDAVAKLFDKLPPYAEEAEAALLGSMILDWQVVGDVLQIIKQPEDLYLKKHQTIYANLVELYDVAQNIDLVQLNQRLVDKGVIEEVGGVEYLVELAESVPSATSAPYYAKLVRDKATLRHLIEATSTILYDAHHSAEPVSDLLDQAEQAVFKLAEGTMSTDAASLQVLLDEVYEQLEAQDGRRVTGVPTGFTELDEMLSGMQPGDMLILAARPSMGKTALALNIAENIAAVDGLPVGVFSLEMGKQQLAQRLLCSRSGVDSHRLRRNMIGPDDWPKLQRAAGELAEAPMFIDDTPGLTLLQLRAKARRLVARHSIKAIFVDYLQLMSAPGSESRQQEVSNISRGIKGLARELKVPVVCLSQLNRQAEQREGHRPRMSDLRESGSIEQDADVVMMLHREDYFHRGEEDYVDTNTAEVIIAKQRNGPAGTVRLTFNGGTTRFENHSGIDVPGGYE